MKHIWKENQYMRKSCNPNKEQLPTKKQKRNLLSRVIGIKKTKRIICIPNIKVSSGPSIINSTTSKQSERIWSENYKIHLNNGAESPLFFLEINNFYRKDNFR